MPAALCAGRAWGAGVAFPIDDPNERTGDAPFDSFTFFIMALVFELSKIALWIDTIKKKKNFFKVLALAFTVSSLTDSTSIIVSAANAMAAI